MTFFTPNAILNFANNPSSNGHEEIVEAMGAAFAGLESMRHEYLDPSTYRVLHPMQVQEFAGTDENLGMT